MHLKWINYLLTYILIELIVNSWVGEENTLVGQKYLFGAIITILTHESLM